MKQLLLTCSILVLLFSVSSCTNSKNDIPKEDHLLTETLDVPVLTIDELIAVGQNLKNNINRDDLIQNFSTKSFTYTAVELEAKTYLQPLINNGVVIQTDVISMINKNNWWGEFTAEERAVIRNFDEAQLAELSLIFSHVNIEGQYNTRASVMSCLGIALIKQDLMVADMKLTLEIGSLDGYITGTAGLITAKTAIKIIKTLAKRTLGIVGVAWAVYDFVDCMND